jgi:hypothetical protein
MKNNYLKDLPKYEELIKSQPKVINSDFEPVIVKDIFTQEEIDDIIFQMDSTPIEKRRVQGWGGQVCFDNIQLSENIKSRINNLMNANLEEDVVLMQYTVVRYDNKHGYLAKLFPHYDTRPCEMFVFDAQLKTNEDWGIIVEGQQFNLNDNEAIIFAGTQQMHWREKKDLPMTTEINMIFFWFTHKDIKLKKEGHDEIMKQREAVLMSETNISSNIIKIGDK